MTSTRAARHPRTWLHAPRRAAVGVHDHGGTQLGVARRLMLVGRGQGTQVSAECSGAVTDFSDPEHPTRKLAQL